MFSLSYSCLPVELLDVDVPFLVFVLLATPSLSSPKERSKMYSILFGDSLLHHEELERRNGTRRVVAFKLGVRKICLLQKKNVGKEVKKKSI